MVFGISPAVFLGTQPFPITRLPSLALPVADVALRSESKSQESFNVFINCFWDVYSSIRIFDPFHWDRANLQGSVFGQDE